MSKSTTLVDYSGATFPGLAVGIVGLLTYCVGPQILKRGIPAFAFVSLSSRECRKMGW